MQEKSLAEALRNFCIDAFIVLLTATARCNIQYNIQYSVCCSVCVAFLSPSTIDQDIEDAFAPKITAGFTKPVCR